MQRVFGVTPAPRGREGKCGTLLQGDKRVPPDGLVLLTRAVEPKQQNSPDLNNDLKVYSISSQSGQEYRIQNLSKVDEGPE